MITVQGSLEEWLRLLRLEEYGPCLVSQGYATVQAVATISIEDLEDTVVSTVYYVRCYRVLQGFYRLGHQKRLVLGIRRLKELGRAGGRPQLHHQLHYQPTYQSQVLSRITATYRTALRWCRRSPSCPTSPR